MLHWCLDESVLLFHVPCFDSCTVSWLRQTDRELCALQVLLFITSQLTSIYFHRADAIDKFTHLPKTSTTSTETTSTSSSTGGKDGDESKNSTSTSTEKKSTKSEEAVNMHRVKALAALDAQTYVDLLAGMQAVIDGYVMILDNLEKNWEKLENPRGKGYGGYGSGGSSMVY